MNFHWRVHDPILTPEHQYKKITLPQIVISGDLSLGYESEIYKLSLPLPLHL